MYPPLGGLLQAKSICIWSKMYLQLEPHNGFGNMRFGRLALIIAIRQVSTEFLVSRLEQ